MPETATLPKTIRARVHEDAIGRVTRFFNATTTETLNELFQNARRAGATRIDLRIADGEVTVTDDGGGIADPAALLAFGQTAWSAGTARREDPAGMGVYALARCPQVTIRSRRRPAGDEPTAPGWQVRLTPAHFLGKETAAVETVADDRMLFGTSVTFEDAKACGGNAERAARYFPLPVTCKGEELPRQDFLRDAVYTEEWRGIRIGVYAVRDYHHGHGFPPKLNFHGILIDELHLPMTASLDTHWRVKVDVIDCPQLELVLPARKEVVETPFVDQLRTACRRAAYRAMLARDPEIDVAASVRADALAHGVELPVASRRLQPWKPAYADEHSWKKENPGRGRFPANAIVIDADIPTCHEQALWRAADRAEITHKLFQADERLKGYDWYDQLRRATALTTTFTVDGQDRHHREAPREQEPARHMPPRGDHLHAAHRRRRRQERRGRHPGRRHIQRRGSDLGRRPRPAGRRRQQHQAPRAGRADARRMLLGIRRRRGRQLRDPVERLPAGRRVHGVETAGLRGRSKTRGPAQRRPPARHAVHPARPRSDHPDPQGQGGRDRHRAAASGREPGVAESTGTTRSASPQACGQHAPAHSGKPAAGAEDPRRGGVPAHQCTPGSTRTTPAPTVWKQAESTTRERRKSASQ